MKKLILLILIASGCESESYQKAKWVCSCQEREKAAAFVQSSIKNANNMSDEEMEDVIRELYRTTIELNCHQKTVWLRGEGGMVDTNKNKFDSCKTVADIY